MTEVARPRLGIAARQRQILRMAERGLSARQMANELQLPLRTIRADLEVLGHGGGGGGGHGGSGGRWLVSYADFVTLMFGFFLILWASASQDPVRFSELALAFQRAFNTGAMLGQQGTGQIIGRGGRMGQIEISPFQRISDTAGEVVTQMGLSDDVSVGMKREGLTITLSSKLLFGSGKVELTDQAKDVLSRVATIMEPAPGTIRVEGHTDNIPYSGSDYPSNWELSSARAASVLRFFTEQLGMPAERFEIAGYGDTRPIYPNDTREHRAENRRVEIVLLGTGAQAQPTAEAAPGGGPVVPPGESTENAPAAENPSSAAEQPAGAAVKPPAVPAGKPAAPAPSH